MSIWTLSKIARPRDDAGPQILERRTTPVVRARRIGNPFIEPILHGHHLTSESSFPDERRVPHPENPAHGAFDMT